MVQHIGNGEMFILEDDGRFYRAHTGIQRWWSEHVSSQPVYDIPGKLGTILVGMCEDHSSWVQWERSKSCSCTHAYDWIRYQMTGRNQGPYGESERTEKNPIRVSSTKSKQRIHIRL